MRTGIAAILILSIVSCTKENISVPSAQKAESGNSVQTAFVLGQEYQGGYIMFIDATGQHGIILGKVDLGVTTWSGGNPPILTGASGYKEGTGKINTKKIIAAYGTTSSYAALLCKRYRGGGYTGWFLPSLSDLSFCIYNNTNRLNNIANLKFAYWSSTEYSPFTAGVSSLPNGQEAYIDKNDLTLYNVRPVRYF